MKVFRLLLGEENQWRTLGYAEGYRPDFSLHQKLSSFSSIRSIWVPPKLVNINADLPDSDLPGILGPAPIFSRRSCEALRPIIENQGEFLPIDCASEEYWVFHVMTILDCLDKEGSKIDWMISAKGKPRIARKILKYQFREEMIGVNSIFIVPEVFNDIFVTDAIVKAVEEGDLKGFRFEEVYPFAHIRAIEKIVEKSLRRKKGKDLRKE